MNEAMNETLALVARKILAEERALTLGATFDTRPVAFWSALYRVLPHLRTPGPDPQHRLAAFLSTLDHYLRRELGQETPHDSHQRLVAFKATWKNLRKGLSQ